jgi:hypothetical protein
MDYSFLTMIIVLFFGLILLTILLYQDWQAAQKQKHKHA